MNVLDINCLRSLVLVSQFDRVRNEEVRWELVYQGSWRVERIREY